MPEPNISTCQDVGMWQIFVRWWWICCTTSCRIVVSSSVGVLYNMSVAGVRIVEFGTYNTKVVKKPVFSIIRLTLIKSYWYRKGCGLTHTPASQGQLSLLPQPDWK